MDSPLISVILPIYNVGEYIPKCMETILNQTYRKLEIVMVDDGSTDNSSLLCDEFAEKDSRIVVYHKENGGLSDARNFGIVHSTGEFITCIDSDDYVDNDYIEYLYGLITKYNSEMSICQHRIIYSNGKIQDYGAVGDEILTNKVCIERMLYHDVIDTSAWAKLYHRNLFENLRYPKGKIFEDIGTTYALMLRCENIAVGFNSKYNYIYRSSSIVNDKFKPSKLDLPEMTDKMAADVVKEYPELKTAVLRRCVYARISTLNQMVDVVGYKKEREEIIKYIKSNRRQVLCNRKTPKRDKVALVLIGVSYNLYRICWKLYVGCTKMW